MTWFRTDDEFWRHKKVRKMGRAAVEAQARVACVGLWQLCGTWSADNLTDGFVPLEQVQDWDPDGSLTGRLVEARLFDVEHVDGEDGIRVHDFADRNPLAAMVQADRAYNARKAALHRDKPLLMAVRTRDGSRCRFCGSLASWKDRRSGAGATYALLAADGPNTLDNLVVACRSCSGEKGERTPEEAGMPLLPPGSMGERDIRDGSGLVPDTHQVASGTDQDPVPTRPDPGPPPTSGDPGEGVEQPSAAAAPASAETRASARALAGLKTPARSRKHPKTWIASGSRPLMASVRGPDPVASSRSRPVDAQRAEQDRLAELDAVQVAEEPPASGSPPPTSEPDRSSDQQKRETA